MAFTLIEIDVAGEQAEPLSEALLAAGALSSAIEDARGGAFDEEPLYGEPGAAVTRVWPRCVVSALFDERADVAAALATAGAASALAPLAYRSRRLDDEDWVRLTQSQFAPIHVSPRLWVVPSWHAAPVPGAINLLLDPGRAFGTGSHASTRLCLRWLDANLVGGESVLDYGCGSGILAIAALKLGAALAVGVDIDAQAVEVARANARANQVRAEFHLPDVAPGHPVDITLANILANPLIVLAPVLIAATRTGGRIVLAGVLAEQAPAVIEAYRPQVTLSVYDGEDDWVCLSGRR